MGRRSYGLSASSINRIFSAYNSAKRARENERLIANQNGLQKQLQPQYKIVDFDFNGVSRISHIHFIETIYYRKIDRYVTQNRQRYPIYSSWLTRTKNIKKTVKLTNEVLENLDDNQDPLIRKFSYEIIYKIGNENFYPKWFIVETLVNEEQHEIQLINDDTKKNQIKNNNLILDYEKQIEINNINIKTVLITISKLEKKVIKLNKKLSIRKNKNHYLFLSIISFGVYALMCSKKFISKIENNLNIKSSELKSKGALKINYESNIKTLNKKINECYENMKNIKESNDKKILYLKKEYYIRRSSVEPLPISISSDDSIGFIPLKKLAGMNYEKIIGCYVIRNIENKKCYVGQSKDVLKRVCRNHFSGTKIKNIIFAEDYYTSKINNKDDLFEVKIIRLTTKDELDKKEKELIEEYDSFVNGYNSTSGNT